MKASTNTVSLLLDVGKIIRMRMERELPLSFTQCETLRLLEQEKDSTMHAIADRFKITAPSATAIVNELVRARLVARTENASDRREVLLHLTPKGTTTIRAIAGKRKQIVTEVLAVLSENDRKQFDVILEKILAGIEAN